MRDIRFRGLRVDGKGWVKGHFLIDAQNDSIITEYIEYGPSQNEPLGGCALDWHQVKYGSVGQFTGMTHKKEGELYIGDKVRVFGEEEYSCDHFSTGYDWSIEGEVCEMDFMLGVNFGMFGFMPLTVIQEGDMDIEIIGNIHE